MKRVFLFLIPVFIFSCKGVEQYRAGIDEMSSKYNEVLENVKSFSASMDTDLTGFMTSAKEMTIAENDVNGLKPEAQEAYNSAFAKVSSSLAGLTSIKEAANNLMTTLNDQGAEVNSLTEGLASGKLGEDTMNKITGIQDVITSVSNNLGDMKTKYDAAKSDVTANFSALKSVFESVMAK